MATLIHESRSGRGALWQGGLMDLLRPENYDVIVLCAEEIQADDQTIKAYGEKLRIILAPNDDSGAAFTKEQAKIAVQAARETTREYLLGKRILVSCAQGRNRSGLVMALVLHLVLDVSGSRALIHVRSKIPNALGNKEFVDFLETVEVRQ